MSLREEMWKYEQITGESAEHVPIIKLGAFLDGYEKGIKALGRTSYKSEARRWKRRYLDLKQRVIKLEEQQLCEDAISRATLLEELGEEPFNWNDSPEAIQEVRDYQWFKSLVENAPPVTPKAEPCDDAISRQAVLALAEKGVLVSNGNYQAVCKVINELPSVMPKRESESDD